MKKKWALVATSALLAISLSGCGASSNTSAPAANGNTAGGSGGDTIKLGVITALTGAEAEFGKAHKRGYDLALEEINKAGGINGKKVELDIVDDKSKPEEAAKDVDQLVNSDKVQLILGSYSSGSTLAVVKKATNYKVPVIAPTATAKNVTETGSKYIFRVCATSDDYAKAVVDFLKDHPDAKTMAVVYEDGNFGTSAAKAMKKVVEGSNIKIVDEEQYSVKDVDYKPLLNRVKQKNPDVIYFASYSLDATALMKQAHEIDLNPKYYTAAGTGFSVASFIPNTGKEAEYTIAAGQWDASAAWKGSKEFDQAIFERTHVHPAYHDIEAYTSLYVAKAAIEKAGALDKDKIRDALATLQLDTPFGPVKFDEKGQNPHPVILTQVQNGKFVTIYPKDAANGQAKLPVPAWNQR
jgi:branched-chain amino acid transport system substrate-binding protein